MLKNNFLKNILVLLSGTAFSQLILFLSLPIITRLYTTEEFGLLSLFISIVGIVSLISSLKYDAAIMLPRNKFDALSLFQLSFLILCIVTLFIVFFMYLFSSVLFEKFQNLELFYWLLPINIFILGAYQIFLAYFSRKKQYKLLSINRIFQTSSIAGLQVLNGFMKTFSLGLIYSKIIGELISLLIFIYKFFQIETLNFKKLSFFRMLINAKKFKSFPKYQSISVFVNSLSQNLPVILLTYFYGLEIAAFYALTIRVLQAPISLIGGSVRQVYYQEASELYRNGKSIYNLYIKTTLNMFKLFILPFFVIILFGKDLFSIIFGANWIVSGEISQILILWIFTTFINPPSTLAFQIFHIQKYQLIIEIISIIFRILAIYLGFILFDSFYYSILGFMIVSTLTNIYIIIYISRRIKREN